MTPIDQAYEALAAMEKALAPCPFCSNAPDICDNTWPKLCTAPHAFLRCNSCHSDGPEKDTLDEAIAAWNTRANLPTFRAVTDLAEMLLGALKPFADAGKDIADGRSVLIARSVGETALAENDFANAYAAALKAAGDTLLIKGE